MYSSAVVVFVVVGGGVCECVSHTRDPLIQWNAFVNIKHVPGDPQSVQLANATTCIVTEYYIGGSVPPHTKDRNL